MAPGDLNFMNKEQSDEENSFCCPRIANLKKINQLPVPKTLSKMASQTEDPTLQEVNLMSLAIPQLNQLKNQLDQILSLFQQSIKTLKVAQTKLSSSGDCLQKLSKENEGTDMLVPLSPFMYVPGKLVDVNSVVIDIGTGYYVQKVFASFEAFHHWHGCSDDDIQCHGYLTFTVSNTACMVLESCKTTLSPLQIEKVLCPKDCVPDLDGAIDYCKRKVNFITEQMEKIQEIALEKSKIRDAVVEVMDIKIQSQSQLMTPKAPGTV